MGKLLRIRGRVQGVGFRYKMAEEARRLGVSGWVRNRHDGSVEAMIDGSKESMDAIIAWAHRGPPSANAKQVRVGDAAGGCSAGIVEIYPRYPARLRVYFSGGYRPQTGQSVAHAENDVALRHSLDAPRHETGAADCHGD